MIFSKQDFYTYTQAPCDYVGLRFMNQLMQLRSYIFYSGIQNKAKISFLGSKYVDIEIQHNLRMSSIMEKIMLLPWATEFIRDIKTQ